MSTSIYTEWNELSKKITITFYYEYFFHLTSIKQVWYKH